MAFHHGKDAYVSLGAASLQAFLTAADIDRDMDVAESSTMGAEDKTFLSGLASGKLSLQGHYDPTVATGPDAIISPLLGSETATAFEYGPQGNTTGMVKYSGLAFVTSYTISAPIGGVVAFKADLRITGAVTRGTFA